MIQGLSLPNYWISFMFTGQHKTITHYKDTNEYAVVRSVRRIAWWYWIFRTHVDFTWALIEIVTYIRLPALLSSSNSPLMRCWWKFSISLASFGRVQKGLDALQKISQRYHLSRFGIFYATIKPNKNGHVSAYRRTLFFPLDDVACRNWLVEILCVISWPTISRGRDTSYLPCYEIIFEKYLKI